MRLVIPGKPVPAARPRIAHGHAYYPRRYQEWREQAAWQIRATGKRVEGPVRVVLRFLPDSASIEVLPGPERPDGLRFDLDNGVKACLDALVAGGVLADDRQVTVLEAGFGGGCDGGFGEACCGGGGCGVAADGS